MADPRDEIEPPKPWEILGAFFGYFAVAKDIPEILRMMFIHRLVPDCMKLQLLEWNDSSNFWLLMFFSICVLILLFWFLPSHRNSKEAQNSSEEERFAMAVKAIERGRKIRIIRSLGFVLLREKVLDWMDVSRYGTFKRHSYWGPAPERFKSIDRVTFNSGIGTEYQYAKNHCIVFVRTHPADSDTYGNTEERVPSLRDIRLLLLASNFFIFWLAVHLVKRPFCGRRNRNAQLNP